ncbi:MAG: MetS family NSS transporter small subunit [Spirochaetales bacterium]|nr:MetS family NSS transporter small subunit [Spirochaetales bacterium]
MSIDAVIMMILGLGITWGGAAVCLYIAIKKQ